VGQCRKLGTEIALPFERTVRDLLWSEFSTRVVTQPDRVLCPSMSEKVTLLASKAP